MEDYREIAAILSQITNIELEPLIEELTVCEEEIGKSLENFFDIICES